MDIKPGGRQQLKLVLVAARVLGQLQGGSQPLVRTNSAKACRVAQPRWMRAW